MAKERKEKKVYVVPEKFLLDIVIASIDINNKEDDPEVAEAILKITSIFAVQLLAPDEKFDLPGKVKKRLTEINESVIKNEPLLGYAKSRDRKDQG